MNLSARRLASSVAAFALTTGAAVAGATYPPVTDVAQIKGTPNGGVQAGMAGLLVPLQRLPAGSRFCMIGDSITNLTVGDTYTLAVTGGTGPYTIAPTGLASGTSTTVSSPNIYLVGGTSFPNSGSTVTFAVADTGNASNNTTFTYTYSRDITNRWTFTPVSQSGPLTMAPGKLYVEDISRGPGWWIMAATDRRVIVPQDYTYGQPGDTTAGVLGRLAAPLGNTGCAGYVLMIGTNDIGTVTTAQLEANELSIYQQLLATGKPVIVGTITPRQLATQSNRDQILAVNQWIKALRLPNLYVVDTARYYGNPFSTTMTPCTGLHTDTDCSYDGVLHPKTSGAYRAFGLTYAPFFNQSVASAGQDVVSVADTYSLTNPAGNLIPSGAGMMTFTGGTGVVQNKMSGACADGWTCYTADNGCASCTTYTGTASQDALADGTPATKIAFGGTGTGGYATTIAMKYPFASNANFAAGDFLVGSCRVETSGTNHVTSPFVQLDVVAGTQTLTLASGPVAAPNPNVSDGAPAVPAGSLAGTPGAAYPLALTIATPIRGDGQGALAATTSSVTFTAGVYMTNWGSDTLAGWVKFGGCSVRKAAYL